MRTLIKLAFAALVIHAAYQIGTAYWDHYQFTDAVQQVAQFGESEPIAEIKERVMGLAPSGTCRSPTRRSRSCGSSAASTWTASTRASILLAPGYRRPWKFTVDVVVLTLN